MPSANDAMVAEILLKVNTTQDFGALAFSNQDKDCLDLALNDISKAISGFYMKSSIWNKAIGVNSTLAFIKFNPVLTW